jgi:hypothetical protein
MYGQVACIGGGAHSSTGEVAEVGKVAVRICPWY